MAVSQGNEITEELNGWLFAFQVTSESSLLTSAQKFPSCMKLGISVTLLKGLYASTLELHFSSLNYIRMHYIVAVNVLCEWKGGCSGDIKKVLYQFSSILKHFF